MNQLIGAGIPPVDINALNAKQNLLSYSEFDFRDGDVLYFRTPSGGGYGDVLERAPESVLADVMEGFVSRENARDCYGVVLNEKGDGVDSAATEKVRAGMKAERK